MAGQDVPRLFPSEENGEARDRATEEDRCPHMPVRLACGSDPGPRGNHHGCDNPGDPLEDHQIGKQPVCLAIDALPGVPEKLLRPFFGRGIQSG